MQDFFSRLQLSIRNVDRIDCDPSWAKGGMTEHSDPFSRLYCLRSGEAELWRGKHLTKLLPGRLYLIPAYRTYRYCCPVAMDLSFIHLSARLQGLGPLHQFVNWPIEVTPTDIPWVTQRVDLILDETDKISYLMKDGALRQLLALFDESAGGTLSLTSKTARFAPVLQFIEENLPQRIYLSDMAQLVHLQPNDFSDLFRHQFGEAPTRYLQRRRAERAAELLTSSDISIKEVAAELGFTDAFHFSRTFKAFMGCAPSIYRERILY